MEPSFFLYHNIQCAGLCRVWQPIPAHHEQPEDAGRDWLIGVSALLEEIAGQELILVLDDFHLVDMCAAVRSILEHLIRWLPAGTRLVLLSRNSIPLNLYREKLEGELLEVQGGQLLFTMEETRELLLLLNLALGEEDVKLIYNCTGGWAAGLRLLAMLLIQAGGDLDKTLAALERKDTDLYTYLNNELLACLPGKLHDFLLDSSLLPYLEPSLCNTALQRNDSEAMILQLHAQGILSRTEGDPPTWRLHHLMEEFLEQKVNQLRPPDALSASGTARRLSESKGDIDRSLDN